MLPSQFKNGLTDVFTAACRRAGIAPDADVAPLEKPRAAARGDFCCPLPLAMARRRREPPRALAEKIVAAMERPRWIDDVQIAAPGFINVFINRAAKTEIVREVLAAGGAFGRGAARAETVLLEFVSANPTGPLHVGHGRACAYGDSLANILISRGRRVRREYYVNDAGRQMQILTASAWLRYWQKQNAAAAMPAGVYRGDYLIGVAARMADMLQNSAPPPPALAAALAAAESGDDAADRLVAAARDAIGDFAAAQKRACTEMMEAVIKEDMRALGVDVDAMNFFHETTLHEEGAVAAALQTLHNAGRLYEEDGALWFKTTDDGDDKDRVVRRSGGELTYFAADVAYHADKLKRARPSADVYRLINVLGADHHGYIPRLRAAVCALGGAPETLETQIIQLVALKEGGERLKMSTRAGDFIPLRRVTGEIGKDAARYFYVARKNDQHLDFDLAAAKAKNLDNPVYYIQYAQARIRSVLKRWGGDESALAAAATAPLADDAAALRVCEQLMSYPDECERAAAQRAPHLLAAYLRELAGIIHGYYETTRVLPREGETAEEDSLHARLAMLSAARLVLINGAALLGVSLPETM